MKKTLFAIPLLLVGVLLLAGCGGANVNGWIRINQLGYLPKSDKIAVMLILDSVQAEKSVEVKSFVLKDSATGKTVKKFKVEENFGPWEQFDNAVRLNFSDFQTPGTYYLEARGVKSPCFRIGTQVYDGTADFLLNYLRQQRCGWNPYLQDSCHVSTVSSPGPTTDAWRASTST